MAPRRMASDDPFRNFAEQPAGIAEWEELLARFELMPKALSSSLAQLDVDWAQVQPVLAGMLMRESWAAGALGALRGAGELPKTTSAGAATAPALPDDEERLVVCRQLADLRGRNFAQLQRRGPGVWDWAAERTGGVRLTTNRLLRHLVEQDGCSLRALRAMGDG